VKIWQIAGEQILGHSGENFVTRTALGFSAQDDLNHLGDDRYLILAAHAIGDMYLDNPILAQRTNASFAPGASYHAEFWEVLGQGSAAEELLALAGLSNHLGDAIFEEGTL